MNTNDFIPFDFHENAMEEIFVKHYELFEYYIKNEPYEWSEDSFDINVATDQLMLKDFLQIRFIEELNEATLDVKHLDHFYEELVDAFNFLLASYFIYGFSYDKLTKWNSNIEYFDLENTDKLYRDFYEVVEQVGKTCNMLKNARYWKNCQYLVDLYSFETEFKKIWTKFNELCNRYGLSLTDLYKIWSCKYQVNKFRIETSY